MSDLVRESKLKGVYSYPFEALDAALLAVIRGNVDAGTLAWLEKLAIATAPAALNGGFVALPRKVGKSPIRATAQQLQSIARARPGFDVQGWTIDRLCRVWLLMHWDATDEASYVRSIENLFRSAEMNELVALYSALPVLAYPELWRQRCAEGIRNNIADVLQAIMCRNPYPAEQLAQPAWNQLVLKAFFTDKPVNEIMGLDARANAELARILSDYAHERWAAHRPVNPLLWRCVGPFIDERIFPDIDRIAHSENTVEREAAALCCTMSSYQPARDLIDKDKLLQAAVDKGTISWETVSRKAAAGGN